MSEANQKELLADGALTVPAAEQFAGVKRSFLYERMSKGELAYIKAGTRRLIPRRALVAMLAGGLVAAGATN